MKSETKVSGGYRNSVNRSDKKLAWKGSVPTETKVAAEDEAVISKGRGLTHKIKLRNAATAIVTDKGRKAVKAKILSVVKNDANRQFARTNIITKGAIIKVELNGEQKDALVTSRPGQTGMVQAVIVEASAESKAADAKKANKKASKK